MEAEFVQELRLFVLFGALQVTTAASVLASTLNPKSHYTEHSHIPTVQIEPHKQSVKCCDLSAEV